MGLGEAGWSQPASCTGFLSARRVAAIWKNVFLVSKFRVTVLTRLAVKKLPLQGVPGLAQIKKPKDLAHFLIFVLVSPAFFARSKTMILPAIRT